MKKPLITLAYFLSFLLVFYSAAYAVPNLMSYQGTLSDATGLPISATVSMTFRIYDVETGGTALWDETQSVPVSNGLFNVKLGSANPISSDLFNQDTLYLGIQVASDPEMIPRQQITSGSYAYKSTMTEETIIPIGGVIAWVNSIPGMPSLPAGWVECNGQTLDDPESPLNGQIIPNLNGENRFLRGGITSGATGGSETHRHKITFDKEGYDPGTSWYSSTQTIWTPYANHLPPFYEVVWIMKIK